MMRLRVLLLFVLAGLASAAYGLDDSIAIERDNNYLSASFEWSQFSLTSGAISGNGARIGFSHYFQKRINLDIYLSTALNNSNGVAASFTGVGGYFYLTALGDHNSFKKTVSVDNVPVIQEKTTKRSALMLGFGVDQYFLNGNQAVYSVSGVGAGLKYQFNLFNENLEVGGRYSAMSSDGLSIQGLFFNLGLDFAL